MNDSEIKSEFNIEEKERVLLVGVDLSESGVGDEEEFDYSMDELTDAVICKLCLCDEF